MRNCQTHAPFPGTLYNTTLLTQRPIVWEPRRGRDLDELPQKLQKLRVHIKSPNKDLHLSVVNVLFLLGFCLVMNWFLIGHELVSDWSLIGEQTPT